MLLFRLKLATAIAIISLTVDAQAHGNHQHHDHDHDDQHQHHSHLRRLDPFSPPPGQCKDGDPVYTIGGKTYPCEADFNAKGGQCRTPEQTTEEKGKAEQQFKWWKEQKAKGKGKNNNKGANNNRRLEGCDGDCVDWDSTDTTVVTIPINFHIFHNGDTGIQFTCRKTLDDPTYHEPHDASDCRFIQDQIVVLNNGFAGISMDDVETDYNAKTKIQFCLAGANEEDDQTLYDNEDYYLDDTEAYKGIFRSGQMERLNVWVNTADGYLGYARFPSDTSSDEDGVVLLNESMPKGGAEIYELGDTLTHEIGHWMGLYHTHAGGCKGAYGDYMELAGGTSSHEKRATYYCPDSAPDTCRKDGGGANPIHNYMSYTQDSCMDEFTPGQAMKMQSAWEVYRHKVGESESWSVNSDGYTCDKSASSAIITGPTPPQPTPTAPTPTAPTTPTVQTSANCARYGKQGKCDLGDPSQCCSGQCQRGNGSNAGNCK